MIEGLKSFQKSDASKMKANTPSRVTTKVVKFPPAQKRRSNMKRSTLILAAALSFAFSVPAFAQRSHPSPGGPPSGAGGGRGNGNGSSMGESHENSAVTHT